jgi:PAS domain S-box-containing protein
MTDARDNVGQPLFDAQDLLDAFASATERAAVVVSPSGSVLAASVQAVELFGFEDGSLIGRTLAELEGPDNAPAVERRLAEAFAGRRVEAETSCTTATGVQIPVEVALSPLRDANSDIVAVLVAYCATHRELRASAALDALLEHIPEGITIADAPDVVIQRVSRHGLELMQRAEEAVTGIGAEQHPDAWQVYDADGMRRLGADELPLTRAVKWGEVSQNEVVSLRKPDGSFVPIMCNAGPIRAPSGEITGGVIAWRDVSDLRDAEAQRLMLLREMHHRVKNAFALANSLVAMVARSSPSPDEMSRKLRERIGALARAQELVRFEFDTSPQHASTTLHALVATVLSPFACKQDDTIVISGPSVTIDARWVPTMALILAELATNAVKHGGLSVPGGSVAVTWSRQGERHVIEWSELAPGIAICAPASQGFGSRLLQGSVSNLSGALSSIGDRMVSSPASASRKSLRRPEMLRRD